MTCQEFLERFSEYRDAEEKDPIRGPFLRHLDACPRCARYASVVERGVEFLHSFPGPEPQQDFPDRLRHRIYQTELEEGRKRRRGSGSGFVPLALAAAAVLTGVAVWGPISFLTPKVSLPAVQARAPQAQVSAPAPAAGLVRSGRSPGPIFQEDLWSQSHVLLYEVSPLYQRTREGAVVRVGLP